MALMSGLGQSAWALPESLTSSEILHEIQGLKVLGSVLYVAAHPDDENTTLISYLAKGAQVETAYLSLTRGDGGQNLIGPQLREELGVIRTQELLAARRVDGGRQFFTRADDFGFSKSPEETLLLWDREAVLSDVVWAIRSFQPDVIVTRFSPEPADTHGHHTASAILALEAFEAAADPTKFPEQLERVPVWQAERLLWNVSAWHYRNQGLEFKPGPDFMSLKVSDFNPLLGRSYAEIAAASRSMHKSQGFGSAPSRQEQVEYFKPLAGTRASSLLDGIDTTWSRLEGGAEIEQALDSIVASYDSAAPYKSVKALLQLRRRLSTMAPSLRVVQKMEKLDRIVAACLGLRLRAQAESVQIFPHTQAKVELRAYQQSPLAVRWQKEPLLPGVERAAVANLSVPEKPSHPYWLDGRFQDWDLRNSPEGRPALSTTFTLEIEGETLAFEVPVTYGKVDPVEGEVIEPVSITPALSVRMKEELQLFPDQRAKQVTVLVTALQGPVRGARVHLEVPAGWSVSPSERLLDLPTAGSEMSASFELTPPEKPTVGVIEPVVISQGMTYQQTYRALKFSHIPRQVLNPKAQMRVVRLELATKGRKVGFLPGAGDAIPEALTLMGYEVQTLAPADLRRLSSFDLDALVLGVRAFNVIEEMPGLLDPLFAYVKKGGTLVVQYNTSRGLKSEQLAPFGLTLSRDRVTDERAAVTILAPEHPVVLGPNRLSESDFEGWVQERGLYFAGDWGAEFTPILAAHDPGEAPLKGGLLVARYGEGHLVYTGYSFFRQLPAGVPGAFRLFANLVSLGN